MRAGIWEILLIVVLIIILFGHAKIPGMMKNIANGINIFKKEVKDIKTETSEKVVEPLAKTITKKKKAIKKKVVAKKKATK